MAEAYKAGGAGLRQARRRHHHARLAAGQDRNGRGLAGALPDVRLGRRPHQRAVGRRPAAGGAAGLDIDGLLAGAAAWTRPRASTTCRSNPAALLALMWHHATGGKGQKDMVVLPYKDRLLLFSRYLQQLVMESLGKQLDLRASAWTRASPSTATRARPTSMPTCSSCATA